jgi:hypothetical protein
LCDFTHKALTLGELFSYTSPDNTIGNLFQGDLGELFSYTSPDNTIGNLFQGEKTIIF